MWNKLATLKFNQAPYHIISQRFNVYILSERGYSVKNNIQHKMEKKKNVPLIHMYSKLDVFFLILGHFFILSTVNVNDVLTHINLW